MARTTPSDVTALFDTGLSTGALDDWIAIASDLVDDIAAADSTVGSGRLERIEKLLAAHFAAAQDPRTSEDVVGDVEMTYQTNVGEHIHATSYGSRAAMLDPTGTLANSGKPSAGLSVPDARNTDS